jgi:hypothetical protein
VTNGEDQIEEENSRIQLAKALDLDLTNAQVWLWVKLGKPLTEADCEEQK